MGLSHREADTKIPAGRRKPELTTLSPQFEFIYSGSEEANGYVGEGFMCITGYCNRSHIPTSGLPCAPKESDRSWVSCLQVFFPEYPAHKHAIP